MSTVGVVPPRGIGRGLDEEGVGHPLGSHAKAVRAKVWQGFRSGRGTLPLSLSTVCTAVSHGFTITWFFELFLSKDLKSHLTLL